MSKDCNTGGCSNVDQKDVHMFNAAGTLFNYKIETLDGVDYAVAPVVMIVEGVLNNAFYSQSELNKNVQQWNGKPLPISHPMDDNGNPITANSPATVREYSVGQIWNAKFTNENGVAKFVNFGRRKRRTTFERVILYERCDRSCDRRLKRIVCPKHRTGASKVFELPTLDRDHVAVAVHGLISDF